MTKKSLIQREKKRYQLKKKYSNIRQCLKSEFSNATSFTKKCKVYEKLQSLPRNSSPVRLRRRCFLTGKSRSNYRDFGLSRNMLQKLFNACLLPGAIRSSW
uniref:Small ribosomal subunit protein uS14c n=1 Tax=Didymoplexis pallens TaxID=2848458 RepID=A0A976UFH3_9ASPA|nr:ribosomal protein S14 [Didymoplexis pallens]UVG41002.1 ribosomal protein S14 [Didymoplexis pallens]